MPRTLPCFLLAPAMFFLVPGCDGTPPVSVRVLDAEERAYHALCACPETLGYPSANECYVHFIARSATQRDCVVSVFDAHESELAAILSCQTDAADNATACAQAVTACDPAAVADCALHGTSAANACGTYPDAVQAGIAGCYGMP